MVIALFTIPGHRDKLNAKLAVYMMEMEILRWPVGGEVNRTQSFAIDYIVELL